MRRSRYAKILATLGPASSTLEHIHALFDAGADAFRLNFCHGAHEEHAERYRGVRAVEGLTKRPVAILIDLQGPKLRVGRFADGHVDLEARRALSSRPAVATSATSGARRSRIPEIFAAMRPAPSCCSTTASSGSRWRLRQRFLPRPMVPTGGRLSTARASTYRTSCCRCRR